VQAKKLRAGLNKVDLLVKKVRAEGRLVFKAGAEYVRDELDHRLSAYYAEYEACCDGMASLPAPAKGIAARVSLPTTARPIPVVRLPQAGMPLEPLAGPDGEAIDLYLHSL